MDIQSLLAPASTGEGSTRTGSSSVLDPPSTSTPSEARSVMSIESMLNPDPFEDLEVAARLADNEKLGHDSGARKLWPIPFTAVLERSSSGAEVDTHAVTNFIFGFSRLFTFLEQNVTTHVRPNLQEGGKTVSMSDRDRRHTWKITRWRRMDYLRRRVAEGFTPEKIAGELRSVPQFTTASTTCYRYGRSAGQETVLDGFAFGEEGLRRLCAQTGVPQGDVRYRLWRDGIQGCFQGHRESGSDESWVVRRLGWEEGEDGDWECLPDTKYLEK